MKDFISVGSKITADGDCSHEIKTPLLLGRTAMTNLDSMLKSRDITLLTKVHILKAMVFPVVSHIWIWELDYKEGWALKNWCFWNVVLEKILESSLDCKEIKPVSPQGNQPWIFNRRTDVKAEALILWPPDVKSWLTGKDPDAGKDWGYEKKGTTEAEMVGCHHQLNRHKFEQIPEDSKGHGSLVCCNPWGCRVRQDWATEQQQKHYFHFFKELFSKAAAAFHTLINSTQGFQFLHILTNTCYFLFLITAILISVHFPND